MNEQSAVIVDIEPETVSVVIVRDGLPEVTRELKVSEGLSPEQWAEAVVAHIAKCVGFHNSLNPEGHLPEDVPVFVTGIPVNGAQLAEVLIRFRYEIKEPPALLQAPRGFPWGEFAANVGLATAAGRLPWQGSPASIMRREPLDFLPVEYRPKANPARFALAGVAAAALIVGLGMGVQLVGDQRDEIANGRRELSAYERRLDAQSLDLRAAVRLEATATAAEQQVERLRAARETLFSDEREFGGTLSTLAGSQPRAVDLIEVDDDGGLVRVRASAKSPVSLLAFARALESSGTFSQVRITSLASSVDMPDDADRRGITDPVMAMELLRRF